MFREILLVGIGGGVGSVLRYLTSRTTVQLFSTQWYFLGTFAVNIIGCFLIGLLSGLLMSHYADNQLLKFLFITGFCGGYTTFSAFAFENLRLIETGQWQIFIGYVVASVLLGIGAVLLGLKVVG